MWHLEMQKDGGDGGRVREEGDDPHLAATRGAQEWERLVDASEEHGPSDASGVGGRRRLVLDGGPRVRKLAGALARRCIGVGPTDADDDGAEFGVRSEDPVIAMPMHTRWWNEPSESIEELEWREVELGASVERGPREPVDEACLW